MDTPTAREGPQTLERALERVGAHPPAIQRNADHLDAEAAVGADGAGVAVLLH